MNKVMIKAIAASFLCLVLLYGCTPASEVAENSTSSSSTASKNEERSSSSNNAISSSTKTEEKSKTDSASTAVLSIKGIRFTIDLANNETASAFANMLPLKVEMSELNGNEKYVYLNTTLPAKGTNPKTIEAGDVMLYGSDCLVVFYKSHPTTYSYTRIGKINDVTKFAETVGNGSIDAEFLLD